MFLIFNLLVSLGAAMLFLYAHINNKIPSLLGPVGRFTDDYSISKYFVFATTSIGIPLLNLLSVAYFVYLIRRK